MKKLHALTGIRAMAALWVICYHSRHILPVGLLMPLMQHGYLGVDLFFMLSGFIISYVHQHEFIRPNLRMVAHFLTLRIARIFPVHYFTLLLMVLFAAAKAHMDHASLAVLDPNSIAGQQLFYHLLNIQAWGVTDSLSWNMPAWSVSAEWFAYLIFPLSVPLLVRLKSMGSNLVLIGLCFMGLIGFSIVMGVHTLNWTFQYALVRVGAEFIIGCGLYNIFKLLPDASSTTDRRATLWVNGSLAALAVGLLLNLPDLGLVMGLCALLYGLAQNTGRVARFLSTPIMLHLGEISFSVYMIHHIVLKSFDILSARFHLIPAALPFYAQAGLFIALLGLTLGEIGRAHV